MPIPKKASASCFFVLGRSGFNTIVWGVPMGQSEKGRLSCYRLSMMAHIQR